ncbi:signal peptidase I [archaeon SCG-AAA382B04]|nr:signal peptidase I [archaeon SCG-AAA382B04]
MKRELVGNKEKKVIKRIGLVFVLSVCLVLFLPNLLQVSPGLIGADKSYTVIGGSMEPTIKPGDVVFTKQTDLSEIEVGDILTVQTESSLYTHRLIEIKENGEKALLQLKGDGNEAKDPWLVEEKDIIGKASLVLPLGFFNTPIGYLTIIVFPLIFILIHQINKAILTSNENSMKNRKNKRTRKNQNKKKHVLDVFSISLMVIVLLGAILVASPLVLSTQSKFTDSTQTKGNAEAGTWKTSSQITLASNATEVPKLSHVTVSGEINPNPGEVPVKIKAYLRLANFSNSNQLPLIEEHTVYTNNNGYFSKELWIKNSLVVEASWEGKPTLDASTSSTVEIAVIPPSIEPPVTPPHPPAPYEASGSDLQ